MHFISKSCNTLHHPCKGARKALVLETSNYINSKDVSFGMAAGTEQQITLSSPLQSNKSKCFIIMSPKQ